VSSSVAAEIMITGVASRRPSARRTSSTSMPFLRGIITSSSTASNGSAAIISSACWPSSALSIRV
jgi:hypothetical protein